MGGRAALSVVEQAPQLPLINGDRLLHQNLHYNLKGAQLTTNASTYVFTVAQAELGVIDVRCMDGPDIAHVDILPSGQRLVAAGSEMLLPSPASADITYRDIDVPGCRVCVQTAQRIVGCGSRPPPPQHQRQPSTHE